MGGEISLYRGTIRVFSSNNSKTACSVFYRNIQASTFDFRSCGVTHFSHDNFRSRCVWACKREPECSATAYWQRAVLQLRLRAGTGPFAAIFCPTKQPSREGNQPGLHCRFVSRSGQWLLTECSLARMEMTVSVWLFYLLSKWPTAVHQEVYGGAKAKNNHYFTFRPRPWLAVLCVTKERPPPLPCLQARVTVELQWKHILWTRCSSLALPQQVNTPPGSLFSPYHRQTNELVPHAHRRSAGLTLA